MARVRDEVPPDLFHPAALGLVLDQEQDQPAVADVRAQGGDSHREARRPPADAVGRHLHLTFPDLAVPADLTSQGQQFLHHELVAPDQPEGPRGDTGLQYPVLAVEDDGRGRQD